MGSILHAVNFFRGSLSPRVCRLYRPHRYSNPPAKNIAPMTSTHPRLPSRIFLERGGLAGPTTTRYVQLLRGGVPLRTTCIIHPTPPQQYDVAHLLYFDLPFHTGFLRIREQITLEHGLDRHLKSGVGQIGRQLRPLFLYVFAVEQQVDIIAVTSPECVRLSYIPNDATVHFEASSRSYWSTE